MKLFQKLERTLKKEPNFTSDDGKLKKWVIIHRAEKFDDELIKLLISEPELKNTFFKKIEDITIFNQQLFIRFLEQKNYLNDSYTKYKNKIGLTINNKYLKQKNEVELVWPFKDCILEGGQNREEQKREEIFFNQTLAQDEINKLTEPKVLSNWERYTADGLQKVKDIKRNKKGIIKENLIIKGNNLLALYSLLPEFTKKIKLIYIDPPYNTGNDGFKYNDNFNHSTWLTFIKNRLEVAKLLLRKDDGIIFVSCDDNEQAYLKVLMDDIFGINNFLTDIIWNSTKSVTNTAIISNSHTHQLVYFSNKKYYIKNRNKFRLEEPGTGFNNPDNDPRGVWKADPFQVGGWRPNQQYEITNPNTNAVYKPNKNCSWKNDYKKFQELLKDNRIVFGKDGKSAPQRKRFLYEAKKRGKVAKTLWTDIETTTNGTQHLKKMFGEHKFSNPKPEGLIKKIIELATTENDIVLDFFAGSGTTGAVAHKMNRQYILIEQMDYIKDLPEARLKNVIGKKIKKENELHSKIEYDTGGISKSVNWKGGGEFIYTELKKYNQTFIDEIEKTQNIDELLSIWEQMKEK